MTNYRQQVQMFRLGENHLKIRDGWHFSPAGRFPKVQKWMWERLVKWGAVSPHYEDQVTFYRMKVDAQTALDKIWQSSEGLFAIGREPREVLIGPETLREIISDKNITPDMAFNFMGHGQTARSVFGIKVSVEPTMEGIIVR